MGRHPSTWPGTGTARLTIWHDGGPTPPTRPPRPPPNPNALTPQSHSPPRAAPQPAALPAPLSPHLLSAPPPRLALLSCSCSLASRLSQRRASPPISLWPPAASAAARPSSSRPTTVGAAAPSWLARTPPATTTATSSSSPETGAAAATSSTPTAAATSRGCLFPACACSARWHGGTTARRALGTTRWPTGRALGRRPGTSTAAARHGQHGGPLRHDPASGWHGPMAIYSMTTMSRDGRTYQGRCSRRIQRRRTCTRRWRRPIRGGTWRGRSRRREPRGCRRGGCCWT